MKDNCPYNHIPSHAFWNGSVERYSNLVPQVPSGLIIEKNTKVASAGSCFAQHIARELKAHDFAYVNAEPGPDLLNEEEKLELGFGLYSARFGNIYSTVQLLQLFERAYDDFFPDESCWEENNAWYDPFRPSVQPGGFSTKERLIKDRVNHLKAVREMFETLDVLVFTMGLTEVWRSRLDGAVFPVCPGCSVGEFDEKKYEFVNLTVSDVVESLDLLAKKLYKVNPTASVILTVSPVPLVATITGKHVVEASTYSKSILRVAAEEVSSKHDNFYYFASYEIITGARRADYFADDLRSVTKVGVAHVMRAFFSLYTKITLSEHSSENKIHSKLPEIKNLDESVECDEEKLLEAQAIQSSKV